ncbi:hypothetical protein IR083_10090 [Dysgonomonas sp. GY75]|uniref:hypothetical protein n=1 Tax=Dysgonomonas sp. GY75 TaxID=2780419 RepID=UPI001883D28A|nr:hypothetical protein [Dysgonomonas sp. GY75]MBF0649170.1 hypothetical protein [Dysgonomonas sp. GY75]
MRYIFKDKYTNQNGQILEQNYTTQFYSNSFAGGNGTRTAPYRSNVLTGLAAAGTTALVLSSGVHSGTTTTMQGTASYSKYVNGQGINKTIWKNFVINIPSASTVNPNLYIKDLTLDGDIAFNLTAPNNAFRLNVYLYFCVINSAIVRTISGYPGAPVTINRCLVKKLIAAATNSATTYGNNNSFVGITSTIGSIPGNLHTFEKCNLIVNQASLDSYKNNYYAFDNCNFRIGTETDYTPLTGTTAEELRTDFVARCTAAGLTVPPDITDYGITLTLGRWIFTKNQLFEGITWTGSEINLFEVPRFISFGYSASLERIGVTTQPNVPGTFSPAFPNTGNMDYQPLGMYLPNTDDVTDLHNYSAASNIISFGTKKQLNRLMLVDSLESIYGVKADTTPDLFSNTPIPPDNGTISAGVHYIVRSTDKQPATISYNGATYSTSLNTRNNLVRGVTAASTYSATSGNPVLYQVNDELQYKTIQVRVANKIPADIIKAGALLTGYWYFVEHDTDQGNTTDYVTYNGNNYPVGSSFLVTGVTAFSITGDIHLRRCWKDTFDFASETVDKDFWTYQQKPKWFDVVDDDPRCLLKNNHDMAHEMETDALGNYIASGHPDFYKIITGEAGILMKPMPIKGAFMQVRVVVSTLNIM